jgi:hypothetical protein
MQQQNCLTALPLSIAGERTKKIAELRLRTFKMDFCTFLALRPICFGSVQIQYYFLKQSRIWIRKYCHIGYRSRLSPGSKINEIIIMDPKSFFIWIRLCLSKYFWISTDPYSDPVQSCGSLGANFLMVYAVPHTRYFFLAALLQLFICP